MAQRRTVSRTIAVPLVALLPLAAAGCGGSGQAASDPGVIRVVDYYNNEPDKTVFQEVLDSCGEAQGVSVERQVIPGGDLIATVLQQASSRTLPDVLMLDNPDLQQIAATGALSPLEQYGITGEGYADGVLEASTYEGELYGLQPVTNTIGLFYDADALAEAGVEPPTTWEELRSAAATLTEGDRYGITFSAINTYEGTWQFLPFMWSNGGSETDLASEANAEALQLWVDLVSDGSASESVVTWSQGDVSDQFVAGNAAMMINGPWQFPTLDAVEGLNYDVVQIPVPEAGDTPVLPFGGETWTVPQTGDADKQAAAAEMVKCINNDENMLKAATERDTVPTKPALVDQVVADSPALEPFAEQVPNLRARTGELGEDWPDAATRIYEAVQNALAGGMTPTEALQQAAG